MCGLVGVMSSNMLMKHKNVLADLLYLDTFRGRDSTGVAALRSNADTSVLKATVPGYEFTEGPKLFDHLKLHDFLWIGHNRFGTVGKNCKTNAHPFMIDDEDGGCLIVGAHNGTLKNKHVLTDHAKFGTDSEALYNEIALNGIEKAIPLVEGAWALTYYDHIEEEFRVLRNEERPLFYAWEEDKKTLFWASEVWMLRIAASRHGIKFFEDKIYDFEPDRLYAFPVPLKTNDEIKCERKGAIVGKQAPAFFHRQGTTGGSSGGNQTATQQEATPPNQSKAKNPIILTGNYGRSEGGTLQLPLPPAISTAQCGTAQENAGEKQQPTNEQSSTELPSGDELREMLDARANSDSKVVALKAPKIYKGCMGVPLSLQELRLQLDGGCGWCETEHLTPADKFAWLCPGKPICHKCLTGVPDTTMSAIKSVSVH